MFLSFIGRAGGVYTVWKDQFPQKKCVKLQDMRLLQWGQQPLKNLDTLTHSLIGKGIWRGNRFIYTDPVSREEKHKSISRPRPWTGPEASWGYRISKPVPTQWHLLETLPSFCLSCVYCLGIPGDGAWRSWRLTSGVRAELCRWGCWVIRTQDQEGPWLSEGYSFMGTRKMPQGHKVELCKGTRSVVKRQKRYIWWNLGRMLNTLIYIHKECKILICHIIL